MNSVLSTNKKTLVSVAQITKYEGTQECANTFWTTCISNNIIWIWSSVWLTLILVHFIPPFPCCLVSLNQRWAAPTPEWSLHGAGAKQFIRTFELERSRSEFFLTKIGVRAERCMVEYELQWRQRSFHFQFSRML